MAITSRKPLGTQLLQYLFKRRFSYEFHQASVLILTFIAYSLYHLSRKPSSIVKNTLVSATWHHPSTSQNLTQLGLTRITQRSKVQTFARVSQKGNPVGGVALSGWAPFDGDSGAEILGDIDVAFLATYAVGTFFAGHLGDRLCLRWVLTVGMIGSGIFTCLYGLAYWWDVHWLAYFFIVQMLSGVFQATGWPSVVSVMANWFGKKKRGLILGVWNAHTSFGNICGSLIASSLLEEGWGWAFLVPGMAIMTGGLLMFFFLLVDPSVVGYPSPDTHTYMGQAPQSSHYYERHADEEAASVYEEKKGYIPEAETPYYVYDKLKDTHDQEASEEQSSRHGKLDEEEKVAIPLLESYSEGESSACEKVHAVGFLEALSIPGVVPFALCLFFAKLVAYTFIYWLPFYITDTEIGGEYLSDETAGNLSTLFDVGGVVGGIVAGHMSDKLNARATISALFTWGAIPAIAMYRVFGSASLYVNVSLLIISGLFVNGPYALITTAVSADLGTHERVKGNARALATVTAIIDGTGSLGAALGPLFTGYLSQAFGWDYVFAMLTISAFISGVLLIKQVTQELKSRSS